MNLIPSKLRKFLHISEHNWLIHSLMVDFLEDAAAEHACGILVDIGCGQKPYRPIFASYISQHIGVDLAEAREKGAIIDVVGTAYETNLEDASCDVILCTEVLEHLEAPLCAVREMHRILKPGGKVILTTPFFWHIHEAPRDFYRYTKYGLCYLFDEENFEILEVNPISGYIVTFTQLSIYYLRRFQKGFLLKNCGRLFNWILQYMALFLNRFDRSVGFSNLYTLVAQKKQEQGE